MTVSMDMPAALERGLDLVDGGRITRVHFSARSWALRTSGPITSHTAFFARIRSRFAFKRRRRKMSQARSTTSRIHISSITSWGISARRTCASNSS